MNDDQAHVAVRYTIDPDKVDQLDSSNQNAVDAAQGSPASAFTTFLSDDRHQYHVRMSFQVPDVDQVLLAVGPHLKRIESLGHLDQVEIYGDVPPEVRDSLKPLHPRYLRHWSGFER